MYNKVSIYGTSVHIFSFDMRKATKALVTNIGFRTVSQAATITGADLVINANDWGLAGIPSGLPNSIAYSEGRAIQNVQKDYRPWFNVSKDLTLSSGWRKDSWYGCYNAVSGDRYVVYNGIFNSAISDRIRKDARTAIGLVDANTLLIVVADGNSAKNIGLTFPELAAIFIDDLNAQLAINLDGGGSTAVAVNGTIANVPNDDGVLGQRACVNHFCLWTPELSESQPPVDPDPTGQYDTNDKLIHEVDGIIVEEYHRWIG